MRKLYIIFIIIFVIGIISSLYLWRENQSLKSKLVSYELSKKAFGLCVESLSTSNDLINNCSAAYREFGSCVTNPDTCDPEQSKVRLQQLNAEKNEIDNRFLEQSKKLKLLISK